MKDATPCTTLVTTLVATVVLIAIPATDASALPLDEANEIIDQFEEEQNVVKKIVRYNFECLSFGAFNIMALIKPWVLVAAGAALITCIGAVAFGAARGINLSRLAQIALCVLIADSSLYIASSLLDPADADTITLGERSGVIHVGIGEAQLCEAWQ